MLCRESLRLENTLKTTKSNQHPLSFYILCLDGGKGQQAGDDSSARYLLCLCRSRTGANSPSSGIFLNQYMQAETKGDISVCGGTVERGEFVHNTHNETSHWLEQCCDTDFAVQYRGVTIINGKIFPPQFLLQVRSRPDKAGIPKHDWTVPHF